MNRLRLRLLVAALCLWTGCSSIDGSVAKPGTWSIVSVPTTKGLTSVRGSGPTDVWILGDTILRWDGQKWNSVPDSVVGYAAGPVVGGYALWVNAPDDVWVGAGLKAADHWTGTAPWTAASLSDNRGARALWGSGPTDVWTSDCGAGYLGHWDGTGWSHLESIDNGRAIWGSGTGSVWMIEGSCDFSSVSSGPSTIVHWNGISGGYVAGKDTQFVSSHNLQAIWGSGTSAIWAVGDSGAIVHYDGRAWSQSASSPTTLSLHGVWGTAAHDVWAVGDSGVIVHFDGSGWSRGVTLTTRTLHAVWGDPSGDVWAVGDTGTVLHLTR
jgi:hypothetical protein